MLKIYSQVNDRLPFVVTGHTSSYKEKGHYPEVNEVIKNMPIVDLPYKLNDENYYFMVLINTENILKVLPLEFG